MTENAIPEELNAMPEFHELQAVKKSNAGKFHRLQDMGAGLDPNGMLMTRLEMFVQYVLSTEQRVIFELDFEKTISEHLDQALSQVAQQTLLEGVPLAEHASQFLVP